MLTKRAKYGFKALVYMARHAGNEPVKASAIAEAEGLSIKFLESILTALRKNGFLSSRKGKFGGYVLLKHPTEIRMVDLMRVLEGPIALVPCVSLNYYEKCDDCKDEERCSINKLMLEVRDSTLQVLRNKTLAEVANVAK